MRKKISIVGNSDCLKVISFEIIYTVFTAEKIWEKDLARGIKQQWRSSPSTQKRFMAVTHPMVQPFENFRLAPEEIADPMQAIRSFFDFAHLPQSRDFLWQWLKTTVAADFNKSLSRRERTDLLHFYEQLEKLIEASYLLFLREETEQPGSS